MSSDCEYDKISVLKKKIVHVSFLIEKSKGSAKKVQELVKERKKYIKYLQTICKAYQSADEKSSKLEVALDECSKISADAKKSIAEKELRIVQLQQLIDVYKVERTEYGVNKIDSLQSKLNKVVDLYIKTAKSNSRKPERIPQWFLDEFRSEVTSYKTPKVKKEIPKYFNVPSPAWSQTGSVMSSDSGFASCDYSSLPVSPCSAPPQQLKLDQLLNIGQNEQQATVLESKKIENLSNESVSTSLEPEKSGKFDFVQPTAMNTVQICNDIGEPTDYEIVYTFQAPQQCDETGISARDSALVHAVRNEIPSHSTDMKESSFFGFSSDESVDGEDAVVDTINNQKAVVVSSGLPGICPNDNETVTSVLSSHSGSKEDSTFDEGIEDDVNISELNKLDPGFETQSLEVNDNSEVSDVSSATGNILNVSCKEEPNEVADAPSGVFPSQKCKDNNSGDDQVRCEALEQSQSELREVSNEDNVKVDCNEDGEDRKINGFSEETPCEAQKDVTSKNIDTQIINQDLFGNAALAINQSTLISLSTNNRDSVKWKAIDEEVGNDLNGVNIGVFEPSKDSGGSGENVVDNAEFHQTTQYEKDVFTEIGDSRLDDSVDSIASEVCGLIFKHYKNDSIKVLSPLPVSPVQRLSGRNAKQNDAISSHAFSQVMGTTSSFGDSKRGDFKSSAGSLVDVLNSLTREGTSPMTVGIDTKVNIRKSLEPRAITFGAKAIPPLNNKTKHSAFSPPFKGSQNVNSPLTVPTNKSNFGKLLPITEFDNSVENHNADAAFMSDVTSAKESSSSYFKTKPSPKQRYRESSSPVPSAIHSRLEEIDERENFKANLLACKKTDIEKFFAVTIETPKLWTAVMNLLSGSREKRKRPNLRTPAMNPLSRSRKKKKRPLKMGTWEIQDMSSACDKGVTPKLLKKRINKVENEGDTNVNVSLRRKTLQGKNAPKCKQGMKQLSQSTLDSNLTPTAQPVLTLDSSNSIPCTTDSLLIQDLSSTSDKEAIPMLLKYGINKVENDGDTNVNVSLRLKTLQGQNATKCKQVMKQLSQSTLDSNLSPTAQPILTLDSNNSIPCTTDSLLQDRGEINSNLYKTLQGQNAPKCKQGMKQLSQSTLDSNLSPTAQPILTLDSNNSIPCTTDSLLQDRGEINSNLYKTLQGQNAPKCKQGMKQLSQSTLDSNLSPTAQPILTLDSNNSIPCTTDSLLQDRGEINSNLYKTLQGQNAPKCKQGMKQLSQSTLDFNLSLTAQPILTLDSNNSIPCTTDSLLQDRGEINSNPYKTLQGQNAPKCKQGMKQLSQSTLDSNLSPTAQPILTLDSNNSIPCTTDSLLQDRGDINSNPYKTLQGQNAPKCKQGMKQLSQSTLDSNLSLTAQPILTLDSNNSIPCTTDSLLQDGGEINSNPYKTLQGQNATKCKQGMKQLSQSTLDSNLSLTAQPILTLDSNNSIPCTTDSLLQDRGEINSNQNMNFEIRIFPQRKTPENEQRSIESTKTDGLPRFGINRNMTFERYISTQRKMLGNERRFLEKLTTTEPARIIFRSDYKFGEIRYTNNVVLPAKSASSLRHPDTPPGPISQSSSREDNVGFSVQSRQGVRFKRLSNRTQPLDKQEINASIHQSHGTATNDSKDDIMKSPAIPGENVLRRSLRKAAQLQQLSTEGSLGSKNTTVSESSCEDSNVKLQSVQPLLDHIDQSSSKRDNGAYCRRSMILAEEASPVSDNKPIVLDDEDDIKPECILEVPTRSLRNTRSWTQHSMQKVSDDTLQDTKNKASNENVSMRKTSLYTDQQYEVKPALDRDGKILLNDASDLCRRKSVRNSTVMAHTSKKSTTEQPAVNLVDSKNNINTDCVVVNGGNYLKSPLRNAKTFAPASIQQLSDFPITSSEGTENSNSTSIQKGSHQSINEKVALNLGTGAKGSIDESDSVGVTSGNYLRRSLRHAKSPASIQQLSGHLITETPAVNFVLDLKDKDDEPHRVADARNLPRSSQGSGNSTSISSHQGNNQSTNEKVALNLVTGSKGSIDESDSVGITSGNYLRRSLRHGKSPVSTQKLSDHLITEKPAGNLVLGLKDKDDGPHRVADTLNLPRSLQGAGNSTYTSIQQGSDLSTDERVTMNLVTGSKGNIDKSDCVDVTSGNHLRRSLRKAENSAPNCMKKLCWQPATEKPAVNFVLESRSNVENSDCDVNAPICFNKSWRSAGNSATAFRQQVSEGAVDKNNEGTSEVSCKRIKMSVNKQTLENNVTAPVVTAKTSSIPSPKKSIGVTLSKFHCAPLQELGGSSVPVPLQSPLSVSHLKSWDEKSNELSASYAVQQNHIVSPQLLYNYSSFWYVPRMIKTEHDYTDVDDNNSDNWSLSDRSASPILDNAVDDVNTKQQNYVSKSTLEDLFGERDSSEEIHGSSDEMTNDFCGNLVIHEPAVDRTSPIFKTGRKLSRFSSSSAHLTPAFSDVPIRHESSSLPFATDIEEPPKFCPEMVKEEFTPIEETISFYTRSRDKDIDAVKSVPEGLSLASSHVKSVWESFKKKKKSADAQRTAPSTTEIQDGDWVMATKVEVEESCDGVASSHQAGPSLQQRSSSPILFAAQKRENPFYGISYQPEVSTPPFYQPEPSQHSRPLKKQKVSGSIVDEIFSTMKRQSEEINKIEPATCAEDISATKKGKKKRKKNRKGKKTVEPPPTWDTLPPVRFANKLSDTARRVLQKFLLEKSDTTEMAQVRIKECINGLKPIPTPILVKAIAGLIVENVEEDLDLSYTPPAPPLTPTQHRLFAFFNSSKMFPELFPSLLREIRNYILPEVFFWPDDSIESCARFYAAACRHMHDRQSAMWLCFDALTDMAQRGHIVVKAVLNTWCELLPKSEFVEPYTLYSTLAFLILQIPPSKRKIQEIARMSLRTLVTEVHGYKCVETKENFAAAVLARVKANNPGSIASIVTIAKRFGWKWASGQIVEPSMNIIVSWQNGDTPRDVAVPCLRALGRILKAFPFKDLKAKSVVKSTATRLANILYSGKIDWSGEENIVRILLPLSGFTDVQDLLRQWMQSNTPSPALKVIIAKQRANETRLTIQKKKCRTKKKVVHARN